MRAAFGLLGCWLLRLLHDQRAKVKDERPQKLMSDEIKEQTSSLITKGFTSVVRVRSDRCRDHVLRHHRTRRVRRLDHLRSRHDRRRRDQFLV